jgi:hypothetical protein
MELIRFLCENIHALEAHSVMNLRTENFSGASAHPSVYAARAND